MLPVARDLLHRPVRPQPRRARQPAARRRLRRSFNDSNTLPRLAAAGRLPHGPHRQVPERLRHGTSDPAYVPPGWNEWYAAQAAAPRPSTTTAEPERLAGRRTAPARPDFKQDVFSTTSRVDAINRNAPRRPVLPGRHVHGAALRRPEPEPEPADQLRRDREAGAAPRRRLRLRAAADAAELQRGRRLRQAGGDPGHALDHRRPRSRPSSASTAAGSSRCSRSTTASRRIIDALERQRRARRHAVVFTSDNGFFHGEHRVQTGKNRVYEEAIRVPLVIRGPGVPAGVTVDDLAINADLAPTILDAAGRDRRAASRTGARCSRSPRTPSACHGRELLLEKGGRGRRRRRRRPAERHLRRDPHQPLHLRRERHRRARALRPRDRPLPAPEPGSNPAYDAVEAALASRLATLRSCAGESCRRSRRWS